MRRVLIAFMTLAMILSLALPAFAEENDQEESGTVVYKGGAENFIFIPGSEHHPTDMFVGFKDVMPGDSLVQYIYIRNEASKEVKIKLYLRALGGHEESSDFLSQLHLRVIVDDDYVLFDASADQSAQLTQWKELGLLYSGGEVELKLILDVPETLDNRFQHQEYIGFLDWEFMIEEFPVEDTDPVPDTGVRHDREFYRWLFFGSTGLMILLLIPRKKKQEEEN